MYHQLYTISQCTIAHDLPPFSDGQEIFILLEIPEDGHLEKCVSTLQSSTKIAPTLDRDTRVLQPSAGLQRFEVSPDFYRVTREEVAAEQKRRASDLERSETLRTKAMRDRDAGIGMRIYHYTVVRVRFPDGLYLQGQLVNIFSLH